MSRLAFAAVAVALMLVGCSHGTKHVKGSACEGARAAALREPRHNVLRGDVDGDGVPDGVALVQVRTAPMRCGAFLVVRAKGQVATRPLARTYVPGVPALDGLAALVRDRSHIVVTTWEGASTAFARVFSFRDGRISEVGTGTTEGSFPYEGSVTHFDAVDCVRPGVIIASGWFEKGANGRLFGFERRLYRVGQARFELIHTQKGTTKTALPPPDRLREFREPQPFPSCMRVRAAS